MLGTSTEGYDCLWYSSAPTYFTNEDVSEGKDDAPSYLSLQEISLIDNDIAPFSVDLYTGRAAGVLCCGF